MIKSSKLWIGLVLVITIIVAVFIGIATWQDYLEYADSKSFRDTARNFYNWRYSVESLREQQRRDQLDEQRRFFREEMERYKEELKRELSK